MVLIFFNQTSLCPLCLCGKKSPHTNSFDLGLRNKTQDRKS
ncbi:hypothetical protein CKA32_001685 [Geitlerinema sp. FC II]|nr:hypothetical protein CKA32_001685 [Geitlerinema sp. FC II]